jgi:hypothetical protein
MEMATRATPFSALTNLLLASGTGDDAGADHQPVTEPLERYRSKVLRKEVYRLKLRIVRKGPEMNDHKNGYMALLRAYWRENAPGETNAESEPADMATTTATAAEAMDPQWHDHAPSEMAEKPAAMRSWDRDTDHAPTEDALAAEATVPLAAGKAHWHDQVPSESGVMANTPTALSWVCEPEPPQPVSQETVLSQLEHHAQAVSPPPCGSPPLVSSPSSPINESCEPQTVVPPLSTLYATDEPSVSSSSGTDMSEGEDHEDARDFADQSPDVSDGEGVEDTDEMQSHLESATPTALASSVEAPMVAPLSSLPKIPTIVEDDQLSSTLSEPPVEAVKVRPLDLEDLDATMKSTHYWESRLTVSKRKIHELRGEMQAVGQDEEESALLRDELRYYTRERKRAVRSLLMGTGGFQ